MGLNFESKLAKAVREELKSAYFTSRNQHTSHSGRVFWVLKTTATNYGRFVKDHPDYADTSGVVTNQSVYNTVNAAIGACTAGQDDVIYVCGGHTETVTSTSINLSISGVSIICLGNGRNQPVFTYGAAAATITVSAANCVWQGGDHLGGFADVASAFTIGAAKNFTLKGANFREGSNVLNFLSIVTTGATANTADGLLVSGNKWDSQATATLAFVSILCTSRDMELSDNNVIKASTSDVGHFFTVAALVVTNFRVLRNTLVVVGATNAAVGIFGTGSSTTNTGIVAYNLVNSLDTTTELIMTAALNLAQFENYYTGTITATGKLWPVVDAA